MTQWNFTSTTFLYFAGPHQLGSGWIWDFESPRPSIGRPQVAWSENLTNTSWPHTHYWSKTHFKVRLQNFLYTWNTPSKPHYHNTVNIFRGIKLQRMKEKLGKKAWSFTALPACKMTLTFHLSQPHKIWKSTLGSLFIYILLWIQMDLNQSWTFHTLFKDGLKIHFLLISFTCGLRMPKSLVKNFLGLGYSENCKTTLAKNPTKHFVSHSALLTKNHFLAFTLTQIS